MSLSTKNRFLLLYGSQTGQAKAISEEIVERADNFNLKADLHCLSQTEKKFNIEREHCVVIVTSTTGDGEPPDTALKFVRRLKKKTLQSNHLENLNYALLGLGDSNYTNFCNNGKMIDRRLEELGAKRFYESGWGDDAVGLEIAVEPWMEGLFPALQKFLSVTSNTETHTDCERLNTQETLENGHMEHINGESSSNVKNSQSNGIENVNTNNVISANLSELTCNDCSSDVLLSLTTTNENSAINQNKSKTLDSMTNSGKISSGLSSQNESQNTNHNDECNLTNECQPSLKTSVPPLSESSVSIPVLPAAYLKVQYQEDKSINLCDIPLQNDCPLPSASSPVTMATISSATVLTRKDAIKKTLCLELDTKKSFTDYMPGDSISVVVKNTEKEVDSLFKRLGILKLADTTCSISVIEGTKKRNASVPSHVPSLCTLRHIFVTCLDIREPPKKALLRVFVECTTDQSEKRRLQELCSKQGAADYTQFVRQPSLSVMDILSAFPSCNPPVERLLEHLPRLQPRPYSICSSPMVNPGVLEIVFNIVHIEEGEGRSSSRTGICTGMLDRLTQEIQTKEVSGEDSADVLSSTIEKLNIMNCPEIPIFNRTNQHFRMSDDISIPIIMVGPGTGVAPFIGFLRHRQVLKSDLSDPELYGHTWLFYGCRHEKRDYIYRKELEEFQSNNVLSELSVCFSRDDQSPEAPKYVQDNIRKHSAELSILIMEKEAVVFVCGDAKNMAKDVNDAFVSIVQSYKGCTENDARTELMKMRLHKRYLEDVWT